ncbi:MAG TPA: methyltransferase domain-containing protein [Candidatus Polarisedimenticolaceae bacterium]|nr:methyltransferase domain-containing protein [Candidatus Polarisedimenticolaceae bacterium]
MDIEGWYAALEERHLASLTFPEVRRALQSLSTLYVGKRDRIAGGAALDGAGKRAAFALFYGPLHFLTVRAVVEAVGSGEPKRIVDLGCGTGVAGAAWALAAKGAPAVSGADTSGWAVTEATWNARALGVHASFKRGDLTAVKVGAVGEGVIAAYAINELPDAVRETMRERLLAAAKAGSRVIIVEPIAKRPFPWWPVWEKAFVEAGGRADTWRFPALLPARMKLLDKAAGLDHRELTARSLAI